MNASVWVFLKLSWTVKFQSRTETHRVFRRPDGNKLLSAIPPLDPTLCVGPLTPQGSSSEALEQSGEMADKGTRTTGLGIVAKVAVQWVVENDSYPGEPRYVGELETSTGNEYSFAADIPLEPEEGGQKIVGRLVEETEEYIYVTDTAT